MHSYLQLHGMPLHMAFLHDQHSSRPTSQLDYENSLLTILIACKEKIAPEPWISMGIRP